MDITTHTGMLVLQAGGSPMVSWLFSSMGGRGWRPDLQQAEGWGVLVVVL